LRFGDIVVHRIHEFPDGFGFFGIGIIGLQGLQGGAADDGDIVAGELVLLEKFPELQFDQVQKLRIIDEIDLVHIYHHIGHLDLAGQEDVLAGLGHGTVGGRHDEDCAVHVGGAGDHVLDVVGMAGAIDVGVVPFVRLVLHMGDIDRNTSLLFLWGIVDGVKGPELGETFLGQVLGNRCRQGRLPVIHVTDGTDVQMRLCPFKFFLGHLYLPPSSVEKTLMYL